MNDRIYISGIERLRSPERTVRLEVSRVVDLCLENEKVKSVLDIGTGSGLFAEEFYKRDLIVAGVDLNAEMINAAKDFLPKCEFKISAAESLPFKDDSYDLLFMGVVFHEVNDYKKVLDEAKRVSKSQVAILEWDYKTEDFGPPLEHRLKQDFIKKLSEGSGFKKIKIIPLKYLVLYKFYK